MNLKEIEYIVKIAEEKGLTRAAEKLFEEMIRIKSRPQNT